MMRVERPHNQGVLPFAAVSNVATALASGMNAILPDEFTCIANGTSVILVRDHVGVRSLDLAHAPDWRPETWAEDLRAVLWQVLSDFQDEIVDQIRKAWPPAPGSSGIAVPHAQVEDGALRGWYGTNGEVVLALNPIDAAPPGDVVATDPPPNNSQPS
jgi:hypothetical protein